MPEFYYKTLSGGLNDVIGQFSRFTVCNHFVLQAPSFLYQVNMSRMEFDSGSLGSDLLFKKPIIDEANLSEVISFDEWYELIISHSVDRLLPKGNVLVDCTLGRNNLYNASLQRAVDAGLNRNISLTESRAFVQNQLIALFRSGSLLGNYKINDKGHVDLEDRVPKDQFNVTIHLRRGDLAVLFRSDFRNTELYNLFEDDVLCGLPVAVDDKTSTHFLSREIFNELVNNAVGLIGQRFKNQFPVSTYTNYLGSSSFASLANGRRINITVCSDGYSRVTKMLTQNARGLDLRALETVINQRLLVDLLGASSTSIIGESASCFVDTVRASLDAHCIINLESYFPMTLVRLFKPRDAYISSDQLTGSRPQ